MLVMGATMDTYSCASGCVAALSSTAPKRGGLPVQPPRAVKGGGRQSSPTAVRHTAWNILLGLLELITVPTRGTNS